MTRTQYHPILSLRLCAWNVPDPHRHTLLRTHVPAHTRNSIHRVLLSVGLDRDLPELQSRLTHSQLTHVEDLATVWTKCETVAVSDSHAVFAVIVHFLSMCISVRCLVRNACVIHSSDVRADHCILTTTDPKLLSGVNPSYLFQLWSAGRCDLQD